jgi:hypothetical protein
VALGSVGGTYASGQILFSPTGNSYATTSAVPYVNETTFPFGDNDTSWDDDFATYNGSIGFNTATEKGDICRYITSRTWVSGNWRLPTAAEYSDLASREHIFHGTWTNGSAQPSGSNSYGNYAHGFAQPTAGVWAGVNVTPSDDNPLNPAVGIYLPASGLRNSDTGIDLNFNAAANMWSGSSSYESSYPISAHTFTFTHYNGSYVLYITHRGSRIVFNPIRCYRKS